MTVSEHKLVYGVKSCKTQTRAHTYTFTWYTILTRNTVIRILKNQNSSDLKTKLHYFTWCKQKYWTIKSSPACHVRIKTSWSVFHFLLTKLYLQASYCGSTCYASAISQTGGWGGNINFLQGFISYQCIHFIVRVTQSESDFWAHPWRSEESRRH